MFAALRRQNTFFAKFKGKVEPFLSALALAAWLCMDTPMRLIIAACRPAAGTDQFVGLANYQSIFR
jgi:hypothetical protein